jgi:hypothetical protein
MTDHPVRNVIARLVEIMKMIATTEAVTGETTATDTIADEMILDRLGVHDTRTTAMTNGDHAMTIENVTLTDTVSVMTNEGGREDVVVVVVVVAAAAAGAMHL